MGLNYNTDQEKVGKEYFRYCHQLVFTCFWAVLASLIHLRGAPTWGPCEWGRLFRWFPSTLCKYLQQVYLINSSKSEHLTSEFRALLYSVDLKAY